MKGKRHKIRKVSCRLTLLERACDTVDMPFKKVIASEASPQTDAPVILMSLPDRQDLSNAFIILGSNCEFALLKIFSTVTSGLKAF